MDFLKKIFGGGDDSNKDVAQGGQNMPPQEPMQPSSVGEMPKKEDHEQGHPNGGAGKNVCEFC